MTEKMVRALLALMGAVILVTQVAAGPWTSNNFFYKPSLGARGAEEKTNFDSGLDRVDARLGNEKWLNDNAYGGNLQTAIATIGSTRTTLSIPSGTWSISSDLIVPANITLKLVHGAVLSIGDAANLTINGSMEAGLYQVFSCTGTGKVVFGAGGGQVVPHWWGAKGDGSNDDTPHLKAALATGRKVYLPSVSIPASQYYKISDTLDIQSNQTLYGDGSGSIIKQLTTDIAGVRLVNANNGVVHDIHVKAPNVPIYLNNSSKCTIRNCQVSENGDCGILLYNSSDSLVEGCLVTHSAVSSQLGACDIAVLDNSQRNVVSNNRCLGGANAHTGIGIVCSTGDASNNIVTGNQVGTHRKYGIVVYGSQRVGSITGTLVANNIVKDILGSDEYAGQKVFGAGIYVADAEHTTVVSNYIENTNVYTDTLLLAPGAIGVNGGSNALIALNNIHNAQWYGIYVTDVNQHGWGANPGGANFDPYGQVLVQGNNIYAPVKGGICIRDQHNVKANDNAVYGGTGKCTDGGILAWAMAANYPVLRHVDITNNYVKSLPTSYAVYIIRLLRGKVSGNTILDSLIGVCLLQGDTVQLNSNIISGCTLGSYIDANTVKSEFCLNQVQGNSEGVRLLAPVRLIGNQLEDNVSGD
jgi:parallel beta-helix repeat protein